MKATLLALVLVAAFLATPVHADPALPLPRVPLWGDQDGSPPVAFRSDRFQHLKDVRAFEVPNTGTAEITFDFVFREASYQNEFGYYLVDDIAGTIAGLRPGDPGYMTALLDRATVVFPSGSTAFTPDVTVTFQPGDRIAFFLVQDATLSTLRANNPGNLAGGSPVAFFSFESLNPDRIDHVVGFRALADGLTQLGFEDITGGGDADFDDFVYNMMSMTTALPPAPPVDRRDVVFVRGLGSEGTCDGMNEWVPGYFSSPAARALYRHIDINQYLNFSYASGGSYSCPASPGAGAAYTASDTCDGVDRAAGELKALIDEQAQNPVVLFGHSMGGVVASYLVATNPGWAKQKIASVLTLDSPVQGITEWEAQAGRTGAFSACAYDSGAEHNSLYQLTENSPTIIGARAAATVVPVYHLDGTKLPDDLALGRERVRLSSGRSFQLVAQCGNGTANDPACQPPLGVDDDHGQTQSRRFDERNADKGVYFGCAAVGALDCAWTSVPVGASALDDARGSAVQESVMDYPVPDGVTRIRFTTHFDRPVSVTLRSPDGTTYGPAGAGPVAGYSAGADYEIYEIRDPAGGDWRLTFSFTGEQPSTLLVGTTIMAVAPAAGNRAPAAQVSVPPHIPFGKPVKFSGIQSYDPDGLVLKYTWDFGGDGVFEFQSDQPVATHTYRRAGINRAALRVTDDRGAQGIVHFTVLVDGKSTYLPIVLSRR